MRMPGGFSAATSSNTPTTITSLTSANRHDNEDDQSHSPVNSDVDTDIESPPRAPFRPVQREDSFASTTSSIEQPDPATQAYISALEEILARNSFRSLQHLPQHLLQQSRSINKLTRTVSAKATRISGLEEEIRGLKEELELSSIPTTDSSQGSFNNFVPPHQQSTPATPSRPARPASQSQDIAPPPAPPLANSITSFRSPSPPASVIGVGTTPARGDDVATLERKLKACRQSVEAKDRAIKEWKEKERAEARKNRDLEERNADLLAKLRLAEAELARLGRSR